MPAKDRFPRVFLIKMDLEMKVTILLGYLILSKYFGAIFFPPRWNKFPYFRRIPSVGFKGKSYEKIKA